MNEQRLPYPTYKIKTRGGKVEEYIIPNDKKEEVLKQLYPFIPVPSLDDELYDIHENKAFFVKDYRVIREGNANLLVSPYFLNSGGTVIDWFPIESIGDQ